MTFHEPTPWAMIVMDGRKPVAKARFRPIGGWLLRMCDGCWTDPRAREPLRTDFPNGFSDLWSKYPDLLWVKSKREARKIMKSVMVFNGKEFVQ